MSIQAFVDKVAHDPKIQFNVSSNGDDDLHAIHALRIAYDRVARNDRLLKVRATLADVPEIVAFFDEMIEVEFPGELTTTVDAAKPPESETPA
ncbi:hypothetical protein HY213_00805 [Candidatus Peregrinibacteria bacterium]|nr:hypothetical protein [Candidatus Peregrinibacteria bacterium]